MLILVNWVLYLDIYCILVLVKQYLWLTSCRYCKKGFELMFYTDMDFLYLQLVSVCSQWLFVLILTLNDKFYICMIYGMWINEWNVLRSIRPFMSQNALKTVYHSYLHSLISYGIIFWDNSSYSPHIFLLQKKKADRIITGSRPRDSCRELFNPYPANVENRVSC
jgi:hypothetical protein